MFETIGVIQYGNDKVVAEVDQGVADFYYALLPKYLNANRQMYPAHVSVVRNEVPPNRELWGIHEGEEVVVEYDPLIKNDETYFWLDAACPRLEAIRKDLGLEAFPPWANKFHITIGNIKKL